MYNTAMTKTETKKPSDNPNNWYNKLMTNLGSFCQHWELDAEDREELRTFVTDIAKEQYMAGNRAGIKWLRIQLAKQGQGQAA